MVARTNFLWPGDLVSQVVAIVVSMTAIMFLLPVLLAGSRELLTFTYLRNGLLLLITLLNVLSCLGRWQRIQQRVAVVTAHQGQALVGWRYDPPTWQAYAKRERRRAYMRLAQWSVPVLLIGALVIYSLLETFGAHLFWPLLDAIGANLLVIFVRIGVLPYYRILHTAPAALITLDGLCIGGNAYFWRRGDATLCAVALQHDQVQQLEFKLRVQYGRTRAIETVQVPVPAGRVAEAETVVAVLAPKV